jgi:exopolyphosphatase/guanosine-5'-triphosphate,3'-diphosphate pyrophosphatase
MVRGVLYFRPMTRAPDPEQPQRLAAIDIGTNSIRMVVAEVEPDGLYRILDEEREMARLGTGLYRTGRLGTAAVERALAALGRMKAIVDGFQVSELRCIATAAVREASNGLAFRREVQRRFKMRVETISAEEEAQFAFQSAVRHFDLVSRPAAVADIGGGSLEVILAAGAAIEQTVSLPLGAVRLTEEYGRSDPLRRKHWRRLKKGIRRVLKAQVGQPPFRPEVLIGSGGTFTNLAEMIMADREGETAPAHGYAIPRADLDALVDRLREMPLALRREMPGLNPKRADIIVAGAVAVSRLARWLDVREILVNERGIRDGLLLSMIGERAPRQAASRDRLESVRAFARRCRSNERHDRHIADLATKLFDGLQPRLGLPAESRDLLVAGALLHDVGYLISHSGHHKHAYHLILHGDIRGFSGREVELIANIARYHRRAFPKKSHPNFARLEAADRGLVRVLAGILRVADSLDRTHTQRVTDVRCSWRDGRLRFVLSARSDPRIEIGDALRKAPLLEKALGARVAVAWDRKARRARSLKLVRAGVPAVA